MTEPKGSQRTSSRIRKNFLRNLQIVFQFIIKLYYFYRYSARLIVSIRIGGRKINRAKINEKISCLLEEIEFRYSCSKSNTI